MSRRRGHGSSTGGPSNNGNGSSQAGTSASGSLSPTMDGHTQQQSGSTRRNGAPSGTAYGNSKDSGAGGGSSSNINGKADTARSAGGGSGHKIAYDPMDLETRSEEAELPKLTLMEEIILLGIKECVQWTFFLTYKLGADRARLCLSVNRSVLASLRSCAFSAFHDSPGYYDPDRWLTLPCSDRACYHSGTTIYPIHSEDASSWS